MWKKRGVLGSEPGGPSSHKLCHVFLSSSLSLCPSFIPVCILSLLCAICLPVWVSVMPQMAFVKDGEITEDFSLWPQCTLHLPLTAWSIAHKCLLIVVWQPDSWPMALLVSLSHCHHYPGPLWGISQYIFILLFLVTVKSPLNKARDPFLSDMVSYKSNISSYRFYIHTIQSNQLTLTVVPRLFTTS